MMQYLLSPPYVYNILLGSMRRNNPTEKYDLKKQKLKLVRNAKLWGGNSKS